MITKFRISILSIKDHIGQTIHFKEKIQIPSINNLEFIEPWEVWGEITRTNKGFFVTGKAKGNYKTQCDRCLETFTSKLEFDFNANYIGAYQTEKEEEDKVFSGDEIDLFDTINESVLLSLPIKMLCHESCHGLCKICGNNKNKQKCDCNEETIDPRLAKLIDWNKLKGGGTDGKS